MTQTKTQQFNPQIFTIWSDEIKGRIDPSFYVFKELENSNWISIKEIAKVQGGYAFKSGEYQQENGVPLVRIQNIKDGRVGFDLSKIVYINGKYLNRLENFLLNDKDILIAMTGATIGKVGRIYQEDLPAFLNQRVGRLVVDYKKINTDYLFYILQFGFFLDQIKRLSLGGAQPNISPGSIEKIKIPFPSLSVQNKVVVIMQKAYSEKRKKEADAKKFLDSIDGYVLAELGIKMPEISNKMFFTVYSDEIEGRRIDPKAYLEMPKEIIKTIRKSKYKSKKLSDIIAESIAGEWGEDPTFTDHTDDYVLVNVLRNTNFDNKFNLNFENVAQRLITKNKFKKVQLKKDDILIEKSGGSPIQPVGRVAIFENNNKNYAFSNFLQCFRINKQKCLPYYLFIYLKSIYNLGYMEYVQNQTTGIKN